MARRATSFAANEMATREITKRMSQYQAPGLRPGIIEVGETAPSRKDNAVAKLSILWERRTTIYKATVAGMVLSLIVAFIIPVRYTSTTRLMPPDSAGGGMTSILAALTKGSSELASLGGELFGLKGSGEVFVGMLHSNTVENAIIDKFDLRKVYRVRTWQNARDGLEDRTEISADRKSGIITIKVSDHSPARAEEMTQEYVNQLNRLVTSLDTSSAHRERVFLESRLNEVQQDLETAEKEFSVFASKNTALDVKEQGKAMIGAAAELEGQLIAAETSLEGLRQMYTANNVRVRSMQARIDEYRRQLQKMGGKTPGTDGTSSDGTGTAGSSQSDYPSIRELPILGVTWADLYRRTRVEEVVFETLTKQYEMAKVEEARETPSVKVLDAAYLPEKKSYPPRLLFLLLGTVFAFLCGSIWILASARWQEVDSADPGKRLAQEVLQTIQEKRWVTGAVHLVRKNGSGPSVSDNGGSSAEREQKLDENKSGNSGSTQE
jgi:capsule polysaccharide export protein KpsE/RkpR